MHRSPNAQKMYLRSCKFQNLLDPQNALPRAFGAWLLDVAQHRVAPYFDLGSLLL